MATNSGSNLAEAEETQNHDNGGGALYCPQEPPLQKTQFKKRTPQRSYHSMMPVKCILVGLWAVWVQEAPPHKCQDRTKRQRVFIRVRLDLIGHKFGVHIMEMNRCLLQSILFDEACETLEMTGQQNRLAVQY